MMSLRSIARSIPRSFGLPIASVARRPIVNRLRPAILQTSWNQPAVPRATFSTLRARWQKTGEVDEELSAKLKSELQLENDARDTKELPAAVKDFLDNGPFKLFDTPGHEEVVLKRDFGNEKITVRFTIADLNEITTDMDQFAQDRALYDEDEDASPPVDAANSKNKVNGASAENGNFQAAPEDSSAQANPSEYESEDASEENEPGFPVRVNVTVEKAGKGALQVETLAHDGVFDIDSLWHWEDPKMANAPSAETEWQGRTVYAGPPFSNLDEDLQTLIERYLDERGINTSLALFVPDYIDFKEQKEYIRWLSNVKSFVDA